MNIREFLNYVSNNNIFYKSIIDSCNIVDSLDIKQYPILTREHLQRKRYDMFSVGYQNKYYWQQLIRKSSSGSTGIPINVYWDYQDYYATMKEMWHRRRKYYGILPNDNQITFSFIKNDAEKAENGIAYLNDPPNILNINVDMLFSGDLHQKLIQLINSFNPIWLYIRPWILQKLLSIYKEANQTIPTLRYIESYGELLSPQLQHAAIDFFGVPVANMYGSEEVNTIAYECPHHRMHIIKNNVFAECYRDNSFYEDGEGELIITSLTNKAMPLIRYNQGDIVKIRKLKDSCPCGSSEPIIEKIYGRSIETIKLDASNELTPLVFLDLMASIINLYDSAIVHYKFVYSRSSKKVICYIVLNKKFQSWYNNITNSINEEFRRRMGTMSLTIEIVSESLHKINGNKSKIFEIVN